MRETTLPPIPLETHISEAFKTMARDVGRNQMILGDVVQALEKRQEVPRLESFEGALPGIG